MTPIAGGFATDGNPNVVLSMDSFDPNDPLAMDIVVTNYDASNAAQWQGEATCEQ
jgi:hypothetical protein